MDRDGAAAVEQVLMSGTANTNTNSMQAKIQLMKRRNSKQTTTNSDYNAGDDDDCIDKKSALMIHLLLPQQRWRPGCCCVGLCSLYHTHESDHRHADHCDGDDGI